MPGSWWPWLWPGGWRRRLGGTTGKGPTLGISERVPHEPASTDEAEIEAVARDYAEGWYTGDVQRMDRALHEDLVKRVRNEEPPDTLRTVTKARMLEQTAKGGGDLPDAECRVFIDDVSTDIASARVQSPEYLDYLHLVRTTDGWKIAHALFRVTD